MNKLSFKYLILFFALGFIISSCTHDSENLKDLPKEGSKPVAVVVNLANPPFTFYDLENDNSQNVELDPLDYYFHPGQSVLLISQRTQFFDPFSEENTTETYKYTYYVNEEANWDYGYNFEPYGDNALDWKLIADNQFNGSYAFGALYYPVENDMIWSVKSDQRDFKDFLSSDILGTYHSTSELKSRLRFRLFHLMACINLKLWVPDWSEENNTGFFDDAVKSVEFLNSITNFKLVFGNKSSEEPPTASTEDLKEYLYSDILMYHQDAGMPREVTQKELSQFNTDLTSDNIREYHFQVLLPTQTLSSDSPLIRFTLSRNGEEKRYLFSSKNIKDRNINIVQGSMTNLTVYIPRFEDDALLIKAEVLDWMQGNSEFTALPRK